MKAILIQDAAFGSALSNLALRSPHLAPSSGNFSDSYRNLAEQHDPEGCLFSEQRPVVDDLEALSKPFRSRLEGMASEPRAKGKGNRQVLIAAVLNLCQVRFITLRCLVGLVKRKPDTLRDKYLKTLVGQRQIRIALPNTANRVRQPYTTVKPSTP